MKQISRLGPMAMRQQRPRGTITKEAVVNAALEVVDRVGVGALTIRAVARRVGAPPMSLYTHFANKEELIDLMYGEVARRLYTDAGHARWQDELAALAERIHGTLLEHPRWIPLLSRPALPVSLPVRERVLRLMTETGKAPEEALSVLHAVGLVAIGQALVDLTFREAEGVPAFKKRFAWQKSWYAQDSHGETLSAEAFAKTPELDLGAAFAFTIRALVDGVSGRLD
jgi:AcrR family transcriptional regulator